MEPARPALEKIVVDALRRAPLTEAVVAAWPLVCGSAVAARTKALAFEDGVLQVQVPDVTWRGQLLDFAPQYVGVLNRMLDAGVRRIAFLLPGEECK